MDINWQAFWQAWAAIATTGLILITGLLVYVGWQAAEWARLRFGQAEEMEAKKREPLVALWLAAVASPESYMANAREGQFDTYFKWWKAISTSDIGSLIGQRSVVVCSAYNIGEGPALRVRVPYRLEVFEITRVGSAAPSQTVDGEFEMVLVPSNSWRVAKTYLDVTYYPKYRVELLPDGATVVSVDGDHVAGALTRTLEAVAEGDNHSFWEFRRRTQPEKSSPPNPFLDALRSIEDKGEG